MLRTSYVHVRLYTYAPTRDTPPTPRPKLDPTRPPLTHEHTRTRALTLCIGAYILLPLPPLLSSTPSPPARPDPGPVMMRAPEKKRGGGGGWMTGGQSGGGWDEGAPRIPPMHGGDARVRNLRAGKSLASIAKCHAACPSPTAAHDTSSFLTGV